MKNFNVTGTCVKHKHYMVDISAKLNAIEKLVEDENYFTINRARQYGKTTTLVYLEKKLAEKGGYICAGISFEDAGINAFESEDAFCEMFLGKVSRALEFSAADEEYVKKWIDPGVSTIDSLSKHITKMCKGAKVVLMVDEVDKSSNNRLFLHFLGMLRAKFLLRQTGKDFTFYSVILVGVTDIKNLKLKMINDGLHAPLKEEGKIVNSPWNIAADFEVDMSFSAAEIKTMLVDYESENKTGMNIGIIASEIHKYTNGYPFLVSKICKHIDEKLAKNWTVESVAQAVRIILDEKNVLFDDLVKNLENNPDLQNFIFELLMEGKYKQFTYRNLITDLAITYDYIRKGENNRGAVISNKMFEACFTDYFVSKKEYSPNGKRVPGVIYKDVIRDGKFDMAMCLCKFAEHYDETYSMYDKPFLERNGRLLFLAFLVPLLNGRGFYHIESQLTDQRRMDIVVDFEKEQYIIELKLWKGEAANEKAYEQLLGYMETKNANAGYLLSFDFRKEKTGSYKAKWVEAAGKKIFDVVV